jgi:ATP-binding cassette subfamily B multidrug efflux pump
MNFSAGERQLISFARAVAFDPEILVLDEATASVDTEAERLIQEGLRGLMAGRTAIVVAHRLSTVRDADRIVVVHRGEKAEEGTHQELLELRGLYYRLYKLQFRD